MRRTLIVAALLAVAVVPAVSGVCDNSIPLKPGERWIGNADSITKPRFVLSIPAKDGQRLVVTLTASWQPLNRVHLYLYSPLDCGFMGEFLPLNDGSSGPHIATVERPIAYDGSYFLLVTINDGAAALTVDANLLNCVSGRVEQVERDTDGNVTRVTIGKKEITDASDNVRLPKDPKSRRELSKGWLVEVCSDASDKSNVINKVTLLAQ
jgi:hypothetical protein